MIILSLLLLLSLAACAQDWLTSAGPFTVEKMSRVGRRSRVSHSSTVNKFLLHTIEGTGGNGDFEGGTRTLDGSGYWPHFIVALDKSGTLRIGQYLTLNEGGRALESGNSAGVIQVEIGGLASKPFTSGATSAQRALTAGVKALFAALRKEFPAMKDAVDGRVLFRNDVCYGYRSVCRVSTAAFTQIAGLIGHAQAPGNSHWDPGAIDPDALLGGSDEGGDPSDTTTRLPTPMPSIPSGPACTYRSHSGSCIVVSTCHATRGSAFSSRAGANGCQAFALNVQCCVKSSALLNDEAGDVDIEDGALVETNGAASAADAADQSSAAGVIAAIVIGVVVVVLVLGAVVYVVRRRGRTSPADATETASYAAASQISMAAASSNEDASTTTAVVTDAKSEPAFV